MEKTWLVMCPDWQKSIHENNAHGWALSKKTVTSVGNDYSNPMVQCIICGKNFSLLQGLKEAFSNDIVLDLFRHDSFEHRNISFDVGNLIIVPFANEFTDVPEVYLTSTSPNPIDAVVGHVTTKGFAVFSSAIVNLPNHKGSVSWYASGNRDLMAIPLWRMLISNSKTHQKNKNLRSEIIELESAFEIFISEYLRKNLTGKLKAGTIGWLLKEDIELQLNIGFTELLGSPLTKMYHEEYCTWKENVKEKRDGVIHRGLSITAEQALDARKALFDLIIRIDNSAIHFFQVGMNERTTDGPCMSFGTATIGKEKVKVDWKAYA